MNFTVFAPEGTTNHGEPDLICTPARWKEILIFFTTNFAIHALTLPSRPGEAMSETIFAVLNAFFIPGYGVARVLRRLILRPALIRHDPVKQANLAGALCMVVKDGDRDWAAIAFSGDLGGTRLPPGRRIHGRAELPRGYGLYLVPAGSSLKPFTRRAALGLLKRNDPSKPGRNSESIVGPEPRYQEFQGTEPLIESIESTSRFTDCEASEPNVMKNFDLACEYGIVKALFSLVQVVSGILTLYHARGNQLQRYGYGAFSLSVIPYVFMSITNFVAAMLCPTYSTVYLIHTPDMDLAEIDGGSFDGVVAELDFSNSGPQDQKPNPTWSFDHFGSIVLAYF